MFNNITKALDNISAQLAALDDRKAIIDYLDSLESRICELPYGDMLYEHAFEIAQVKLQSI